MLENCEIARYTLIDFSPQMLELSRSRLAKFKDRTVFIQADFKKNDWTDAVPAGFDLVASLQAVHELRHASRIPKLYAQLYSLLVPGGTILICDHVNSSSPSGHHAAHFMTVEEHLSTFKKVGFIKRERNLPRRRPEPDGSGEALRPSCFGSCGSLRDSRLASARNRIDKRGK